MSRKTIAVADVLNFANTALAMNLASDDPEGPSRRRGIIQMIEPVLLHTDNYKGYRYLPSEFDTDSGFTKLRDGYDDTRRAYFA